MQTRRLFFLVLMIVSAVPALALGPENSAKMSLTGPRGDVVAAYGKISELSGFNRRTLYLTMSPTMQTDLWILHLEYFLQDHEDLKPRQRAVVYEVVRFLETGALSKREDAVEWPNIQRSLNQLELRVKAALGEGLAREATAQLGPDEYTFAVSHHRLITETQAEIQTTKLHPTPLSDCECSVSSDLCCFGDCTTSPTPHCHYAAGWPGCTETRGCGALWLYSCDGICGV